VPTAPSIPSPDALPRTARPIAERGARCVARLTGRLAARWALLVARAQAGMSTAEYAVGTVAACAFAAVLYRVVTGGSIVSALGRLISHALDTLS
jgi:hypothetical protein